MRLTCPTCGAQYEVQDAMIPPAGRDVQCSACSTTWFQPGRRPPEPDAAPRFSARTQREEADIAEERPPAAPGPEAPARRWRETAETSRDGDETNRLPDALETATQVVDRNDPDNDDEPVETPGTAPPRGLDPSVRDILRAEALREARLRQAEATPVETQAEMPLVAGPGAAERRRLARAWEDDSAEAGTTVSRRDLLPDIEEINSTLRAAPPLGPDPAAADASAPSPEVARRRGVRIGFFLTLALVALLVWVYVNAADIAVWVPEAAPALEILVASIDGARFWLDDLARGLAKDGPGT
ncbi:MAG: zinc-ribbon domain-containing protein [Roseicyclus sp.]